MLDGCAAHMNLKVVVQKLQLQNGLMRGDMQCGSKRVRNKRVDGVLHMMRDGDRETKASASNFQLYTTLQYKTHFVLLMIMQFPEGFLTPERVHHVTSIFHRRAARSQRTDRYP
jgi:hypothetical protein